jgi:MYXO-CTERM domain-containing protein
MNRVDTNTDDDDGMDLGWLGLLGLAGLLGLRRRDNHTVHHTDTTARRP